MFTPAQEAQLKESNLLQTAEIVAFSANLIREIQAATVDDGKVGVVEGAMIAVNLLGSAKDAFQGIAAVPGELKDLTPEEVEILADILFPALVHLPSAKRDALSAAIGLVREGVNLARTLAAPKAHPVPE